MKTLLVALLGSTILASISGCIVEPRRHGMVVAPAPVYVAPAPVYAAPEPVYATPSPVYVEPTYASPGVGFVWEFHPRFGWGWRHPKHGWHRGWR